MQAFATSIVDSVRHPLLVLDAALHVRAANPAFYRVFQLSPEETIAAAFMDLATGASDLPRLSAALDALVSFGVLFDGLELEYRLPDLAGRVFQFSGRSIDREESLYLLAVDDVTHERKAQADLRSLNEELEGRVLERTRALEASNRELEAFSYSVSHDLRSPLRADEGFADELLRSYAPNLDDRGRHYLDRIRASGQRMASLIDDLLKLSRLTRDRMVPEHVDLSALARAISLELGHEEPSRHVELIVQDGLEAHGDERLLQIALENLLRNSWKFTSKVARARIEFGERECRGKPAYFVSDNGAGFDMSFSQHLFGAFHRLHKEKDFPGTGVGLATVQRVVRRHGGDVWAEGKIGEGATFYFTVPSQTEIH